MAKANGRDDDGTEKVSAAETRVMIPGKKLKELLGTMRTAKRDKTRIASALSGEIASAIGRYGCNRKVLGLLHFLDGKENEQIADFLDELEYSLDASGLKKRAESAPRFENLQHGAAAEA